MARRKRFPLAVIGILTVAALAVVPPPLLFAQATIPAGSTITSAELSLWADSSTDYAVSLNLITADWDETLVTWNSFNGSYDPAEVASFVSALGWNTVDVTTIVQAWLDGNLPNFGFYLTQAGTSYSKFFSSEIPAIGFRPVLEISYVSPSGFAGFVVIQRPGGEPDGVRDASIFEGPIPWANTPVPFVVHLFTGSDNGFTKASLIRFHFLVAPGTGTPGYWMNHPENWPVEAILIGGRTYDKATAIDFMKSPGKGDKTYSMFEALVAAKLNVLIGNDDTCISAEIQAADEWMANYPVGSGVKAGGKNSPWRIGEPIQIMLDDYNNGRLPCAEHRD